MMSSREETRAIGDEGRKIDVGKRDQRVDRLVQYYDSIGSGVMSASFGVLDTRRNATVYSMQAPASVSKEFKVNSADVP